MPRSTCQFEQARQLPFVRRMAYWTREHFHPSQSALVQNWFSPVAQDLAWKLSAEKFDLVWGERLASLGFLRHFRNVRRVIDLDDLEDRKLEYDIRNSRHSAIRKLLMRIEMLRLRRTEHRLPSEMEVVVCSELDRKVFPMTDRVSAIPNGVELPSLVPSDPVNGPPTLIFVGSMSYGPNVDAVLYFCREVLPRIKAQAPEARFLIVGREPSQEVRRLDDGSNVIVKVPAPHESLAGYWAQAHVAVVPIRVGGGTRIKILEAMAHGRPVVSTSIGAEGIEVADRNNILLADEPAQFARLCLDLLQDLSLRSQISTSGNALVRSRYDWDRIEHIIQTDLLRTFSFNQSAPRMIGQ
ncbi:MAG TPA: glycosyltransferase family 4 protein [Candidatus Acidoferrales bacterium]|nr:glycosyltransferase family 4 protein [Candidatus Acidoferrales bacterium]